MRRKEKHINDEYSDDTLNSPILMQLLKEIKSGKVAEIVYADNSRLSKDIHDVYKLANEASKWSVKLKSLKTEERLIMSIQLYIIQIYRKIERKRKMRIAKLYKKEQRKIEKTESIM